MGVIRWLRRFTVALQAATDELLEERRAAIDQLSVEFAMAWRRYHLNRPAVLGHTPLFEQIRYFGLMSLEIAHEGLRPHFREVRLSDCWGIVVAGVATSGTHDEPTLHAAFDKLRQLEPALDVALRRAHIFPASP